MRAVLPLVHSCAIAVLAASLSAQAPYMVVDRTPGALPMSSAPQLITMPDGRMIGAATDDANGRELWITDGTTAGSRLVLDINPGRGSSDPRDFVELGGAAYFFAVDEGQAGSPPVVPRQLWRSDGTTAGTWLVKAFPRRGSSIDRLVSDLTVFGGALYFVADDSVHGRELWRSDGTPAGTALLKDVVPGEAGAWSATLFPLGDRLLYAVVAVDPSPAVELWSSDGTPAGTVKVHSFAGAGDVPLQGFVRAGGVAMFSAFDAEHGQELWRSDGTEGGTAIVKDIAPGPANASPVTIGAVGGVVLFLNYNEPHGLWRSDGSEAGTFVLAGEAMLAGSIDAGDSAVAGGKLFFSAWDPTHGGELWASDGSLAGTGLVRDIAPGSIYGNPSGSGPSGLTALGSRVLFAATDGGSGRELWASDGSEAGTVIVRDIRVGYEGSQPSFLVRNGDRIFFAADDGAAGSELWVSDGTANGTTLAVNLAPDVESSPTGESVGIGSRLFFTGPGLWTTDGTEAGTVHVSDVQAEHLTRAGGRIYFQGYDPVYSYELWRSDGTRAGTHMVRDIAPGAGQANPDRFTPVGLRLYFRASDASGLGLWYCDSSSDATSRVALPNDIYMVLDLGAVAGTLFLTDYYSGAVWRTDGTRKGTVRMTASQLAAGEKTGNLYALGNRLLFTANDGPDGYELWRSDGTPAGTGMVTDICPGECSSVMQTGYGDSAAGSFMTTTMALFFIANDGTHGRELFRSDGTAAGTSLVADLAPGASDSDVVLLGSLGNTVIFSHDDGEHGVEPWVSDGTAAGTRMLADINPGSRGSNPGPPVTAGGHIYFAASDDLHGRELWRSDGTTAGTELAGEINLGPASSSPEAPTVTDSLLFFFADDGVHGRELWALPYAGVHPVRRRMGR